MKFKTLAILIVFLSGITIIGQSKLIQPIDSNYVKIHKEELKFITTQFIELNALKFTAEQQREQINLFTGLVADKDKELQLKNELIEMLKVQIEDQRPAWWNKFTWGFVSAVVLLVTIFVSFN